MQLGKQHACMGKSRMCLHAVHHERGNITDAIGRVDAIRVKPWSDSPTKSENIATRQMLGHVSSIRSTIYDYDFIGHTIRTFAK